MGLRELSNSEDIAIGHGEDVIVPVPRAVGVRLFGLSHDFRVDGLRTDIDSKHFQWLTF
jgi:hypothetical protein